MESIFIIPGVKRNFIFSDNGELKEKKDKIFKEVNILSPKSTTFFSELIWKISIGLKHKIELRFEWLWKTVVVATMEDANIISQELLKKGYCAEWKTVDNYHFPSHKVNFRSSFWIKYQQEVYQE